MGRYTRLFVEETRGYLRGLEGALEAAARGGEGKDMGEARRMAHSIKGMALFEEQAPVADLALALERGFAGVEAGKARRSLLAALGAGVALLAVLIGEIDSGGAPVTDPSAVMEAIMGQLER